MKSVFLPSKTKRSVLSVGGCFALLIGSSLLFGRPTGAETPEAVVGPKTTGHPFVAPRISVPKPVTEQQKKRVVLKYTSAARDGKVTSPKLAKGSPKGSPKGAKTRGSAISPNSTPSSYSGLPSIFQYTNDGAPNKDTACGQAAVATILTHYGIRRKDRGSAVITEVFNRFPPDVAGIGLGTSWQRVGSALDYYGVPFNWYTGEAGLKNALDLKKPCIIMLDVGAIPEEGWGWGGHWVVAYAYDRTNIYLTNWNGDANNVADGGKCTWVAFRKAWNTWMTQGNGTTNRFLCPNG